MAKYNVLAVCGSGTVTSSMVAGNLKDTLAKEYDITSVSTTESQPSEALTQAQSGNYDFIINTSPLPKADYGIPVINATGLLTGFGEEEFFEEVMKVIKELNK